MYCTALHYPIQVTNTLDILLYNTLKLLIHEVTDDHRAAIFAATVIWHGVDSKLYGGPMKFPRIGRWFGQKKQSPLTAADHPSPSSSDIDFTIKRRLYYRPVFPGAPCPRCRTALVRELGTYVVITKHNRRETEPWMIGGDFGHYCPRCPTIVINPEDLEPYLDTARRKFDVGKLFAVLGLVALEDLTEEEKNTPVEKLDSIPLVPFYVSKPKGKKKKR